MIGRTKKKRYALFIKQTREIYSIKKYCFVD